MNQNQKSMIRDQRGRGRRGRWGVRFPREENTNLMRVTARVNWMKKRKKRENKERKQRQVVGIGAAIRVAKEAVEEKGVDTTISMRVMISMLAID